MMGKQRRLRDNRVMEIVKQRMKSRTDRSSVPRGYRGNPGNMADMNKTGEGETGRGHNL